MARSKKVRIITLIRRVMIRFPYLARVSHYPAFAPLRKMLLGSPRNVELTDPGDYESFRQRRMRECAEVYADIREPGLLCFVTTVWNTDPSYLEALAKSVFEQSGGMQFEWLLVDNGSTDTATRECLRRIAASPIVRFERLESNRGIIGGMRFCLETASSRYILPLDSDDTLYPKCVSIVTGAIHENDYPPLLYTDEDKLEGGVYRDPYYKSDWDPVLFANSCYIAHLCAIDRKQALELGCYSDAGTEGSHDWDTFTRFAVAGCKPVHVPEVLYSWRMHPQSTAANFRSKPVIFESQRTVLQRLIHGLGASQKFEVVESPLFPGTPDWLIRRRHVDPRDILAVGMDGEVQDFDKTYPLSSVKLSSANDLVSLRAELSAQPDDQIIYLQAKGVVVEGVEWAWEAIGQFELFMDCAMVGGSVLSTERRIIEAGQYFGFAEGCGSPDEGRNESDFGYFAKLKKAHSVSAVSAEHSFVRRDSLMRAIDLALENGDTAFQSLGRWCGLAILESGRRTVYSPYLQAVRILDGSGAASRSISAFIAAAAAYIPEERYYSPHLGLTLPTNFRPVAADVRKNHLEYLMSNMHIEAS